MVSKQEKKSFLVQQDNEIDGPYIKEWNVGEKPKEEEIMALEQEWLDWKNANAYKEKRQLAYASIPDQLDMIYWDKVNGTNIWFNHVAQVHLDYPK